MDDLEARQMRKVIFYLFTFYKNIDEMVLMVQKEVAIKFDYQIISMNKYKFYSKLFSNYQRCFEVSSKVFKPKPKVQSTVVKFKINKNNINIIKAKEFSDKIFKNKRKKISNKLKINKLAKNQLMEKRIDKLSIEELLYIYNLF